jgi:hypothetical protein
MGEVYVTVPLAVIPGVARIYTPEPGGERGVTLREALPPEGERDRGADSGRSQRMEGIRDLLETARANGLVVGRFRGLLHIAIGRTVTKQDGTKLSAGLTWRELATLLKNLRFDPELGREIGADPDTLFPRDRERYWYAVITQARVDGAEALAEAEKLIDPLKEYGFSIAPPPGGAPAPVREKGKAVAKEKDKGPAKSEKPEDKSKKKKK